MRSPKSPPDLNSIVNGLRSKLQKFNFTEENNLFLLFDEILKKENWNILNKGTHYEQEQKEFTRSEVLNVIQILEKMDEKINSFNIELYVGNKS